MVTPVLRAVDLTSFRNGLYTALAANSTISALTGGNIFWVGDVTNSAPTYYVLTLLTYVPANTYTGTSGTAHVQATAVSPGSPDDARAIAAAGASTIVDTRWTIAGWDVLDTKQVPKPPDSTPFDQSKVIWEERERYEIKIRKQQ